MSSSGVDSMFFSDVTALAEQVDDALLEIKSESVHRTAVKQLAERLLQLKEQSADDLVLRLVLTLTDHANRSLNDWCDIGQQLATRESLSTIAALESLARSLESEQSQLESRLRQTG